MKINKFFKLLNTIRYLKYNQIYYRLFYYARNCLRRWRGFSYSLSTLSYTIRLSIKPSIRSTNSLTKDEFLFLNISHRFDEKIDWNFPDYGKLWTYNLTYFEFLNQQNISKNKGLDIIYNFIDEMKYIKDGLEPFPISLRGINWIKFLIAHDIRDQKVDDSLYAQYLILMDNIEYHLLGNHLLENAFSLLFGAYYFQDEKFYAKAKQILTYELEEQILQDGGHFELSPMYHQIMLFRVLDCINLVENNSWKNIELLDLLIGKAESMLGWLSTITYENGNIPLLNDSTNKIAPTTKELNDYALSLTLNVNCSALDDSGYRKIKKEHYELTIDIGNIGPDYIPGHAHSDTFNFELYVGGKPLIVDTGLSTYETNTRRSLERSTASHNTVMIDGKNQSEVWGGFRVAKRAKIIEVKENNNTIEATHDGYKHIGALHTRKFTMHERSIAIEDHIKCSSKHSCIAYLHFYPGIEPKIDGLNIIVNDVLIETECTKPKIENYSYAPEFNTLQDAKRVILPLENTLKIEIKL